jgi:hypothetical protein
MRMLRNPGLGLVVVLAAAACGDSPTDPGNESAFPALLSELDIDAAEAILFEPQWKLWTNGSVKTRKIWLQDGGTIATANRAEWSFPDGTRFSKTFSYLTQASPNTPVPVETRIIRRRGGQWEPAGYLWRDDGSDADLLDGDAPTPVPIVDAQGRSFTHQIPSLSQCQVCHGLNPTFPIGFSELNLNNTLAGRSTTQLAQFASMGFYDSPVSANPTQIVASDAETLAILGYVQGNCRHCHNQNSTLDLSPATFLQRTVDQTGPSGLTLITPQDPDGSLIYTRFSSGSMPALGVQLPDSAARAMLRTWIETHNF